MGSNDAIVDDGDMDDAEGEDDSEEVGESMRW